MVVGGGGGGGEELQPPSPSLDPPHGTVASQIHDGTWQPLMHCVANGRSFRFLRMRINS